MAVASNVGIALVLTCVGSFSTALGGLLVVLQRVPDMKRLGLLQGFASGLMLSLSFFDLVPNAIQAIGFAAANVWFFAGCLLFAAVVTFIPEPNLLPDATTDPTGPTISSREALASPYAPSSASASGLVRRGSARAAVAAAGSDWPTASAAAGAGAAAAAGDKDRAEDKGRGTDGHGTEGTASGEVEKDATLKKRRRAVLYSGIITAVGISMHNFPEGIAVFLGSMKGLRVGISLAVAIALHNVPEGLAVALPIYYATRNRWVAFRTAALSGLAEPLAVVFVALFFPGQLAPELIEGMLAGVGGIMAFLTLHEMLPLAFEYAGHKTAVSAAFVGMAVMSANLQLLAMSLPADIAL